MTSVGSTTGINPEKAAQFSSGGFSNIFPRSSASYQSTAVSAYLSALNISSPESFAKFSTSGRAFPDVSTQGQSVIISGGEGVFYAISGTSASSPIFASIIALLNDELATKGKPALGFLNPFLYSGKAADAFNDITHGTCAILYNASGRYIDPIHR